MKKIYVAAVLGMFAFVPGVALADTVTPFGSTTGTGPWDLVASYDPITSTGVFSGVEVTLSTPIQFSSLATLSATFTDILGGYAAGSPRFNLFATSGDYFFVYPSHDLGAMTDSTTFTSSFSGVNLNNSDQNSQFHLGSNYVTLATLESFYSTDLISVIDFIIDASSGNPQHLTLNSITINGTTFSASTTPLPAALPLFATGLGALGLLGWRRKRKAAAVIAA